MISAAKKNIAKEQGTVTADMQPIINLMTPVLMRALCPLLRSEIMFAEMRNDASAQEFNFWSSFAITGDIEGSIGVGCDRVMLRSLANHLGLQNPSGTGPNADEAFQKIERLLKENLEKFFTDQQFDCGLAIEPKETFRVDSAYRLCPLETKFGTLCFGFRLAPASNDLRCELDSIEARREARKIRVFASQLEEVFAGIKDIERLERELLAGAHVRALMRSRIKKLKRELSYLKSESLETLFSPSRKLVLEIAKTQGKQVRLSTHGTWLSLDKSVLNYLYEPCLHLIRNAVDHGIEEPAERERVGKPACGTVKCLAAFSEKGLRLIVSDDGKGLDYPRIRETSVAKGLLTAEQSARALNEELAPLIFEPGFSTRSRADAISGRGMGLDIVQKGITSIGGTLRILSSSHHGTSFEICMPLDEELCLSRSLIETQTTQTQEDEEKALILEEVSGFLEKLSLSLSVFRKQGLLGSAYEAYRYVHSIKGAAGFLGWNRVAGLCHHYEDLLKLVAEEKFPLDESTSSLVTEVGEKLQDFCEASRSHASYSLLEVRRLESRLLQAIYRADTSEEHTHFFFGKYHLASVQKMMVGSHQTWEFRACNESEFAQAQAQPFGALIQFGGDRRGYAGILMPEATLAEALPKLLGGRTANEKQQLNMLSEFAATMGRELSDYAHKHHIELQPSAPITYFGWGNPLRTLGNPTYCYACEVLGHRFYLVGDFRGPSEVTTASGSQIYPSFSSQIRLSDAAVHGPTQVMEEALKQCEKHLGLWDLGVKFSEVSTQSDLVGFDGGITGIISCTGAGDPATENVIFLSYDQSLAKYLYRKFAQLESSEMFEEADLYDCLNETSNILGGLLVAELEKRHIKLKLSLPAVFAGRAYVANFNRLFSTNKWVGMTSEGRCEIQVMVLPAA